ncbi:MAG TPA: hypothetical protein VLB12_03175 [Gemmatimonadales bacterium]|nr:hypothetical protein [Gemmatimonadales bacterium]
MSSLQTMVEKVVIPVVWLLIIGLDLFARDPSGRWVPILILLIGGTALLSRHLPLKRISMDQGFLYIAGLGQKVKVPLQEVRDVREDNSPLTRRVVIEFSSKTPLGREVMFMPKFSWDSIFGAHPVTAELRNAAARARGETESSRNLD